MSCLVDKITKMFSCCSKQLYDNTLSVINRFNMAEHLEGGVLLGLSGGADSVFLLCFLLEYRKRTRNNFTITAVHINHLIRGDEATRDEDFCRYLTDELGVEFISRRIDIPKLSMERKLGIEETARDVRYSVFDEIINGRNDISSICLAHNASDNLETVIFNMMRGSGLSGVCGIPPVRGNIVRPLIHLSKSAIVGSLETVGIPFVTDSSNNSCDYTRNYIRHEIVPKLYRLSPSPEASISKLTSSLIADNEFILKVAESSYAKLISSGFLFREDLIALDVPVFVRVLDFLFDRYAGVSASSKHISDLYILLSKDNFSYSIGRGFSFVCMRGKCRIIADNVLAYDDRVFSLEFGVNLLDGYSALIYLGDSVNNNFSNVYNFSIHTDIPFDIINGKLRLRFRRDGDSYSYGGMTHKLKKVFNDRNISPIERDRIPIIFDDDGILWIPGLPYRGYIKGKKGNLKTIRITIFYSTDNNDNRIFTAKVRD